MLIRKGGYFGGVYCLLLFDPQGESIINGFSRTSPFWRLWFGRELFSCLLLGYMLVEFAPAVLYLMFKGIGKLMS